MMCFSSYMYNPVNCPLATCGVYVGSGIATALSLLCLPAPFVLYKKGAGIRKKCKYAAEAAAMMERMDRQIREQAARKNGGNGQGQMKEKEELATAEKPPARDEEEGSADASSSHHSSHSGATIEGQGGEANPKRDRPSP